MAPAPLIMASCSELPIMEANDGGEKKIDEDAGSVASTNVASKGQRPMLGEAGASQSLSP